MVTDIEGSSRAWELVPSRVMDACLSLHHAAVRASARAHFGTESATEG